MIDVYKSAAFLRSLEQHRDNIRILIQQVRVVYGQDISNLQVLYVMSRGNHPAFFPKNLLCVKIEGAIRDMTPMTCVYCSRISGRRPDGSDKCDMCTIPTTFKTKTPEEHQTTIQLRIEQHPGEPFTMQHDQLYCLRCRKVVSHATPGKVRSHLNSKKHQTPLQVTPRDPVPAGSP